MDLFWIQLIGSITTSLTLIGSPAMFVIPDMRNLLLVLFNGICISGVAWYFILRGIQNTKITLAALLLLIQPFLAFLLESQLKHESISSLQIIGLIIILSGLTIATLSHQAHSPTTATEPTPLPQT